MPTPTMIYTATFLVLFALVANAEIAQMYQQCGGSDWKGATECAYPATCYSQNPYYYQCTTLTYLPDPTHKTTAPTITPSPPPLYWNSTTTAPPHTTSNTQLASMWGQCGGEGWMGPTLCSEPATCFSQNAWYYQCTTFPSTAKEHHTSTEEKHHTTEKTTKKTSEKGHYTKPSPSPSTHKAEPHKTTTLATKPYDGHH